ncbi:NAD(P)-dependent oxidoreductase [Halomonas sp. SpR1]|uniref:NAD(P)-dependent oxidoreductase n=1 Tax=unclassified Halomonas TaxID=2609666 RepID=UPI0007D9EE15|nr:MULTISPECIES: NAD(P)-dependent oxidoreductase [unclassified Halomonas]MBT2786358.1 NAD(P)-dependent oxidoreductase [Halomonas sp. ISL-106]MBT2797380.1 NAD(P)-dependent oxidoreductase [Halomonas sp. ISL-104]MDQ7734245.1 NAD(P)-dependent oxidoreductase [Halomonas sp. SpR1]OAL58747.1 2-hydroxy-3-oxopropionate reductase [Halomonas sp. ALS9]
MSQQKIAVLGTGIMGRPMARNLLRAGYVVSVWNRSLEKAALLSDAGAHVAASPSEAVKGCDAVVVMVSSGQVCEEVLFDQRGAIQAMNAGSLLIVMSSIGRGEAISMAQRCDALGLQWLDAPVSGGEKGAIDASLSIMAGGTPEAFALAEEILLAMGRPVHIGPAGTGALAKLVNQLTVASTICAVSEALLLAEAGGADPARVREALLGGFANSRVLEQHGQRMLDDNFLPGGPAKYQLKDTRAASAVAQELELDLPLLALTDRLFADLVEAGGGELDHSALYLEVRRRNGFSSTGLHKVK